MGLSHKPKRQQREVKARYTDVGGVNLNLQGQGRRKSYIAHCQPNDHAVARIEASDAYNHYNTYHGAGGDRYYPWRPRGLGSSRDGCGGFVTHQMYKLTLT